MVHRDLRAPGDGSSLTPPAETPLGTTAQQQITPPASPLAGFQRISSDGWEADAFYLETTDANEPWHQEESAKQDQAPATRTTSQIRSTILESIASKVVEWDESEDIRQISGLAAEHSEDLDLCKRESGGAHPTILHWIVDHLSLGYLADENRAKLRAAKILILLALHAGPELLTEPKESKIGETALHKALSLPEDKNPASLVWVMCRPGESGTHGLKEKWKEALETAATKPNSKGETCVHLAIMHNQLEIARHLIRIVSQVKPDSLLEQRKHEANGELLADGGNTPLHDAVAHKKLVLARPESRHHNGQNCKSCSESWNKAVMRKTLVRNLIEELISANPMALTKKNSSSETPYLRLSSTRPAKVENRPEIPEQAVVPTPEEGKGGGRPIRDTEPAPQIDEKREIPQTGRNTSNTKAPTRLPPAPAFQKSVADMGRIPDVQWPLSQSRCPEVTVDFSQEVEESLREMAFTIGEKPSKTPEGAVTTTTAFENACKCFFGGKTEKETKTPQFIHFEPVSGDMLDNHPFLKFTKIMSQVHIQLVATTPVEKGKAEGREIQDLTCEGTSQDQGPESWRLSMRHLMRLFKKLREDGGVQQILKLTVVDNPSRPCTDEVIERCLRDFDVRYLDWNKPDLCADVILAVAPNIVELTLHSSGNSSVLRSWAAENGLCNLNLLSKLTHHSYRGSNLFNRYHRNVTMFEDELREIVSITRAKLACRSRMQTANANISWLTERANTLSKGLEQAQRQKSAAPSLQQQNEVEKTKNALETAKESLENLTSKMKILEQAREDLEQSRKKILLEKPEADYESGDEDDAASTLGSWKLPHSRVLEDLKPPILFRYGSGRVVTRFRIEPRHERPLKQKDNSDIAGQHGDDDEDEASKGPVAPHQWLKAIDDFNTLEAKRGTQAPEIKVCLIDDGVTTLSAELGDAIAKGWPTRDPWVTEDPYYHSPSSHGTIMAGLIKRVCPNVKLYVAKLGSWKHHVDRIEGLQQRSTAQTAAEAIQWAIDQKVHIISMSWSLIKKKENESQMKQIEKLGDKITLAGNAENKIIMFCSASDDGVYGVHKNLYPGNSGTKAIKTIGSSDEHGKPSKFVDESSKLDYLFPGEGIDELQHGSSAATALAAGLAALILWCYAKESPQGWEKKARGWENMESIFRGMRTDNRFVDVTALLKPDTDVRTVVSKCDSWIMSHSRG